MTFKCKERCGSCCGIIPIPEELANKTTNLIQKDKIKETIKIGNDVYFITKDMFCIYLDKKKRCMIYDERPMVCRLYGTDPRLPCPHFRLDGTKRDKLDQTITQIKINEEIDSKLKSIGLLK